MDVQMESAKRAQAGLVSMGLRRSSDLDPLCCGICKARQLHASTSNEAQMCGWCARCCAITEWVLGPDKPYWKFIGRDKEGWLGFRCLAGPGSIWTEDWAGDVYVDPEHYWRKP